MPIAVLCISLLRVGLPQTSSQNHKDLTLSIAADAFDQPLNITSERHRPLDYMEFKDATELGLLGRIIEPYSNELPVAFAASRSELIAYCLNCIQRISVNVLFDTTIQVRTRAHFPATLASQAFSPLGL